jgi:hypothetical protein
VHRRSFSLDTGTQCSMYRVCTDVCEHCGCQRDRAEIHTCQHAADNTVLTGTVDQAHPVCRRRPLREFSPQASHQYKRLAYVQLWVGSEQKRSIEHDVVHPVLSRAVLLSCSEDEAVEDLLAASLMTRNEYESLLMAVCDLKSLSHVNCAVALKDSDALCFHTLSQRTVFKSMLGRCPPSAEPRRVAPAYLSTVETVTGGRGAEALTPHLCADDASLTDPCAARKGNQSWSHITAHDLWTFLPEQPHSIFLSVPKFFLCPCMLFSVAAGEFRAASSNNLTGPPRSGSCHPNVRVRQLNE